MTIRPISGDDLVLWPDGTTCYHRELPEYGHMSDDYEIIPVGSSRYEELTAS